MLHGFQQFDFSVFLFTGSAVLLLYRAAELYPRAERGAASVQPVLLFLRRNQTDPAWAAWFGVFNRDRAGLYGGSAKTGGGDLLKGLADGGNQLVKADARLFAGCHIFKGIVPGGSLFFADDG